MSDPFAPIDGKAAKPAPADWRPVQPAPADAPAPPSRHPALGAPSARWDYRDASGDLLGSVWRFDPKDGKQFRPLVLYRNARNGALEWRWQAAPAPRPLYGLDVLSAMSQAPVVVTEGEKAADAARRLLPNYVVVTSQGGSNGARTADWTVLRGRPVTLWLDADAPGGKYADQVAAACVAADAASVKIIAPPAVVRQGWDAADALAEGWTPDQALALVAAAKLIAAGKPGKKASSEDGARKERRRRQPARDGLLALCEPCTFWHAPDGTPYVTYPVNDHRESWKIRSDRFKRWLVGRAYEANASVPGGQAIEDALRYFEGKAVNDGDERETMLRVGKGEDCWYLDLCDKAWRVIVIRDCGWTVREMDGLPFVRSPAMQPLPEPEPGSSIEALRPFLNVESDSDFIMVVGWLLAALDRGKEYPILVVQGEQGSGKSTFSRLLRGLVDPNSAPIRAAPKDEEDLLVAAKNGHVIALDNLSKIDATMADALCRLATGAGFSTRVKYTDGDEYVVYSCNPILINGIPALAERPDLARRALIVHLKTIPEEARQPEDEFWEAWERVRPSVLGALCDALCCALRRFPTTHLKRYQSMAYFEKLIEAAGTAFGWAPGAFSDVYAANRLDIEGASYEANPVAMAIGDFIADETTARWTGTATRLLEVLGEKVSDAVKRTHAWPKTAQGLGNQIERVKPLLRSRGIMIERKISGERFITIFKKSNGGPS